MAEWAGSNLNFVLTEIVIANIAICRFEAG